MDAIDSRLSLRAAMEARDRHAAVAAFAEDAIVRSPLTDGLVFQGPEQIDALVGVIFEVMEDFTYSDEVRGDGVAVLVGHARIDGLRVEFCDHLRMREDGRVQEMTVFFRPLPATTAALRAFGCRLGARRSARRGRLIGAMAAPLAFMARTGDRVGVRLIRG